MSWNYRVIRTIDDDVNGSGDVTYSICECHYDKKGDTIPTRWADPATAISETRAGLFWVLAVMTEGVAKPILEVQAGKMVEVEPSRELTDDLKKAIAANKKYAEGMA